MFSSTNSGYFACRSSWSRPMALGAGHQVSVLSETRHLRTSLELTLHVTVRCGPLTTAVRCSDVVLIRVKGIERVHDAPRPALGTRERWKCSVNRVCVGRLSLVLDLSLEGYSSLLREKTSLHLYRVERRLFAMTVKYLALAPEYRWETCSCTVAEEAWWQASACETVNIIGRVHDLL
jgi:hypothetical protein